MGSKNQTRRINLDDATFNFEFGIYWAIIKFKTSKKNSFSQS